MAIATQIKQLNPYTLHGLLARNAKELPDH